MGHFLYLDPRFGDRSVCEHDGTYKSSELSRFRHSKKKFRTCVLCGYENLITAGNCCDNTLLMVEYVFNDTPWNNNEGPLDQGVVLETPAEAGHGAYGRGGHFVGTCLCSPNGCGGSCGGFTNALGPSHLDPNAIRNPNLALVSENDIVGWTIGKRWVLDENVMVSHQDPVPHGIACPLLWRKGRLGGHARILKWSKCGGRSFHLGYHGSRVLSRSRWQASEEDASILLLHTDGSHGLDLSFATHLFLLEKIKDPSLERQIISRAHRMGAKGAVSVQLLQTKSTSDIVKIDIKTIPCG